MKKGEAMRRLEELGCDPIEALYHVAVKAERDNDLKTASGCYKELAKYCHPQLRSVEVSSAAEGPIRLEILPLASGSASKTA